MQYTLRREYKLHGFTPGDYVEYIGPDRIHEPATAFFTQQLLSNGVRCIIQEAHHRIVMYRLDNHERLEFSSRLFNRLEFWYFRLLTTRTSSRDVRMNARYQSEWLPGIVLDIAGGWFHIQLPHGPYWFRVSDVRHRSLFLSPVQAAVNGLP